MTKLSVVVPCFNEEDVLQETYKSLVGSLEKMGLSSFNLIFINDGSSDGTREILNNFKILDPRIEVIHFSRNFGHQSAILAGLKKANGDCIAVIDADLQDPPSVIYDMILEWRKGYKVVYGIREKRKEKLILRAMYHLYYRFLKKMANIDIPLDSGDFCLMDKAVVRQLISMPERNKFIRGLRSWLGYKQIGLKYEREKRFAGESKYSFIRLLQLGLDGIFSFSMKPLRFVSILGILISIISLFFLVFFIIQRVIGFSIFGVSPANVPGWTSLAIIVLLMGGIQLFTIGLIGEYVGRTYVEGKNRPEYIVDEDNYV